MWKLDGTLRLAVAAAVALGAVACSDSTGPGPEAVDPVATSARVESFATAFSGNEGVDGLEALGPYMAAAIGEPTAALFPPSLEGGNALTRTREMQAWLNRAGSVLEPGPRLWAIPSELLGKTLVYNPSTEQYEVDPARTGAPANGVRFVLYAVDPVLGTPVVPLVEVGHADISATSSATSVSVTITVVVNQATVLQYTVSAQGGATGGAITASGFVSNGTDRLDFYLQVTGTDSSASAVFDLSSGSVSVHIELDVDTQTATSSFSVRIRDGLNTILLQLAANETTQAVEGSVRFNGAVVALISGTFEEPVVTNASGGDLSPDELEAVGRIFVAAFSALGVALELFLFGLVVLPIGTA